MLPRHRTRLAPSPTGALHLGNVRTFLINWALARQEQWDVVLRIEDIDGPRIKPGAVEQSMEVLEWLGLDWDEGPTFQSHDLAPYQQALVRLAALGQVYPCGCTRTEILAATRSAPHGDGGDLRYPGTCRPTTRQPIAAEDVDFHSSAWRVCVPAGEQTFVDRFAGPQAFDVSRTVGDFPVWTKGALPSYQLAVVIDDARQGIDRVVRGDDLLSSTPRQRLLAEQLALEPRPEYWHVPLVRGEDGRRLAKRHGDTRLASYRQRDVDPRRVVGLVAEWCGLGPRRPMAASEFADLFQLERLPRTDIVFRPEDDAWLLS